MESEDTDRTELMCREAESMCRIILDSLYDNYKPYDVDSCDGCEPHPVLADIIFGGLDNAYPIRFDSRAYYRDNPDGKPFDAVQAYMTALAKDEADRKKMASYVEFAWRKYNLAFRAYMVELGMCDFFKENLYSEAVCARPDGEAWDVDEPDIRTKRESHEWEAFWSRMWRYDLRAPADMDKEFKDTYFELENNTASELFRLLDLWGTQNSGI